MDLNWMCGTLAVNAKSVPTGKTITKTRTASSTWSTVQTTCASRSAPKSWARCSRKKIYRKFLCWCSRTSKIYNSPSTQTAWWKPSSWWKSKTARGTFRLVPPTLKRALATGWSGWSKLSQLHRTNECSQKQENENRCGGANASLNYITRPLAHITSAKVYNPKASARANLLYYLPTASQMPQGLPWISLPHNSSTLNYTIPKNKI